MQVAKKAVESVKETAANIGASAKSGMEKTKAVEEMATRKKEERIHLAELEKQEARNHNAAVRQSATSVGGGPHTGQVAGKHDAQLELARPRTQQPVSMGSQWVLKKCPQWLDNIRAMS
ncbi:hypothetical protein L6164_009453 [Bauhinia variegata]|uniref:Uncharacterized protein n=1 Tax=Bauhinia variegata TaxID=167791 RepID=A0ACB9PJS5_BAUVA|nr:hypothetical protein L6164_009453 [Bauhinia variegata]